MQKDYISEIKLALKDVKLDFDLDKILPDKSMFEQGVDSLDHINMLFAIEEYFQIKVSDEDLVSGKLDTLNGIFEIIECSKKN